MEIKDILSKVDHTVLGQSATWSDIKALCDDGIKYGCASVCIAPSYVKKAKQYVGDNLKICTVIGFPNGYSTTAVKCFETAEAVKEGADEIDMVINIGMLKDKQYDLILNEINQIKKACNGKLLKVIIETCLLTDEEKIKMCQIVSESDADYIKTSTGFSTGGATREDIRLFSENVTEGTLIKAAGGIASIKDAEDMLLLGASRLGTSRIVKIIKNEEGSGY
ncbi:MAG: deoxyribose-phosphate aldolase [Acutalibacteraceae bacterium]